MKALQDFSQKVFKSYLFWKFWYIHKKNFKLLSMNYKFFPGADRDGWSTLILK